MNKIIAFNKFVYKLLFRIVSFNAILFLNIYILANIPILIIPLGIFEIYLLKEYCTNNY